MPPVHERAKAIWNASSRNIPLSRIASALEDEGYPRIATGTISSWRSRNPGWSSPIPAAIAVVVDPMDALDRAADAMRVVGANAAVIVCSALRALYPDTAGDSEMIAKIIVDAVMTGANLDEGAQFARMRNGVEANPQALLALPRTAP